MPPAPGAVADVAAAQAPAQSPHRSAAATPQSPLRIKQDGKFYERLLTRESSAANPSFRYYWAEPGSVPFVWESQPGTPKDAARTAAGALPAITPPPAYLLRPHGAGGKAVASSRHGGKHKSKASGKKKQRRRRLRRIRVGFIAGIFRRLALGRAWRWPAPPAKVSSSSRWLFSTVAAERGEHDHDHDHHDEDTAGAAAAPPQSKAVLCSFRARRSPCLPRLRATVNRSGGDDGWA
ncbi:hypothetical protein ACP4OV_019616 [Aristida adscensionis]